MRNWIVGASLGLVSAATLLVFISANEKPTPIADEQPTVSPEPTPPKECPSCTVVNVTDLDKAFAQPPEEKPFVSFDEPPLANPQRAVAANPFAPPPMLAVVPTVFEVPVEEVEILPAPRPFPGNEVLPTPRVP